MNAEVFDNPDLVDAIFKYLGEEFPQLAPRLAELQDEVRQDFSGIEIYIPRRSAARRKQLEREVLSLFNGRNASEVARKLNLGRATVYRIIKQSGKK
ncbi:Mor transcription activator family protein [Massilia aerilata]|uniref:Mor transcription activator family protein n=1 Tax=Massilia aerilata TaxID=453817 RepID=A0ABW0RU82_9BURK